MEPSPLSPREIKSRLRQAADHVADALAMLDEVRLAPLSGRIAGHVEHAETWLDRAAVRLAQAAAKVELDRKD